MWYCFIEQGDTMYVYGPFDTRNIAIEWSHKIQGHIDSGAFRVRKMQQIKVEP